MKLYFFADIGPKISQFYEYFLSSKNDIKTVFDIDSEHGQVGVQQLTFFFIKTSINMIADS